MSKATRATRVLEQAGIAFTVHEYPYDPDADSVGLQAAAALGEPPDRVLKTLMTLVDGKPACVILPSHREVSMKKLAAVLGGKSAQMMKPADAERATGYKVGMIKIQELRRKAEAELGGKFDIKGFHDTVLGGGALPLTLLERRVDQWIAKEKAKQA